MKPILKIHANYPLQQLNTFGIAASAERFLTLTHVDQLPLLHCDANLHSLPRLILGGGSNMILPQQVGGLVIKVDLLGRERVAEDAHFFYVRAAAGENWHDFVQWTVAQGWGGLENLSLIPGTVGAAPIQNIGAYGIEMQERFHSLKAFDFASGEIVELDKAACRFGYRDSVFKHEYANRMLILDVTFALPKVWQARINYADVAQYLQHHAIATPQPQDVAAAIIAIRRAKLPDPAVLGNAGSFFKNPVVSAAQRDALLQAHPDLVSYVQADGRYKLAAGWLIERSGWKGRSLGPVSSYAKQALVLVNHGGATGEDVAQLAQKIQEEVRQRYAVELEAEPIFVKNG